jgi:hypothetical protein
MARLHLADGAAIVVDRPGIDNERADGLNLRRPRCNVVASGDR